MTPSPQRAWSRGYALLMVPPFLGLLNVLLDLPRWLEVATLLAMLALVFTGTRLLFRTRGGQRPSATMPREQLHDVR